MYVPHEPNAEVLMLIHMVIFVVTLSFEGFKVTKLGRIAHNGYFHLHST